MKTQNDDRQVEFEFRKDFFDAELTGYDAAMAQTYAVIETNWSEGSQVYIKPHIVTAIDTATWAKASQDIRTAFLNKWGGHVSVTLMKGDYSMAWAANYHYVASYKGVYIAIFSEE